jgi:hypothetical protein
MCGNSSCHLPSPFCDFDVGFTMSGWVRNNQLALRMAISSSDLINLGRVVTGGGPEKTKQGKPN